VRPHVVLRHRGGKAEFAEESEQLRLHWTLRHDELWDSLVEDCPKDTGAVATAASDALQHRAYRLICDEFAAQRHVEGHLHGEWRAHRPEHQQRELDARHGDVVDRRAQVRVEHFAFVHDETYLDRALPSRAGDLGDISP